MTRRTRIAPVVVLVALMAVPAPPAVAAKGRIKACASKKTGVLRVPRAHKKCRHGESKLVWNKRGRRGRRGHTGAKGAAGIQGAQGPAGTAGGPAAGSAAGGGLTGTYPNPLIAAGAVSGPQVVDDALSGADIDELSLAKVPDADLFDGLDSATFLQKAAQGSTAFDFAGLNALACSAAKVADTASHGTVVLVNNPYDTVTPSLLSVTGFRLPDGAGDDVYMKVCNLNPIAGINPANATFDWMLVG